MRSKNCDGKGSPRSWVTEWQDLPGAEICGSWLNAGV